MSAAITLPIAIALIVASCAPAAVTPVPSTTRPDLLDVMVDIGGHKLRIVCSGQGSPTVVVDSAWAEPALEAGNWTSIRYGVEEITRICLYDRAGLGSSEPAPEDARTSLDQVKDLRTLLDRSAIPGPYVLVGHGIGGYNAILYADRYPGEIAGLVLVDAYHPEHWSRTLELLPSETANEPVPLAWVRYVNSEWVHDTRDGERMNVAESALQAGEVHDLGALPVVVISGSHPQTVVPGLPADLESSMDQVWQELQVDLVSLSSNGTHVVVPDAGPFLQLDQPQPVIDAILKVVEAARK